MRTSFRFTMAALALAAGLPPAIAQEANSWRDPDQGCWYLMTPQGGIGLRYRRDGTPDCPDARTASAQPAPAPPRPSFVPAGTALAAPPSNPSPAARSSSPYDYPASQRQALSWSGSGSGSSRDAPSVLTAAPPALNWPSTGIRQDAAPVPAPGAAQGTQVAARSMSCWPGEGGSASDRLSVQRVTVDKTAMAMTVEALADGVTRTERYSIDSNMDAWLGGRNQRDPRLGFVFTQSRGQLRLDWPEGGSLRAIVRSYSFRCQAEGGVT